uniref:Secreted protein n=1 Tax=Leersia perrieri TaxID=77586 RepID=A0A0D9W631_9ORYZ
MGELQQLTIVALMLRELAVSGCFNVIAPIADISAPVLEKLQWIDFFSSSSSDWVSSLQLNRTTPDAKISTRTTFVQVSNLNFGGKSPSSSTSSCLR